MASKAKAKDPSKKPAKKRANGYEAPKHLPEGTILTDAAKNQWKIGPVIGSGGFGEIYSACRADAPVKKHSDYPFVVKIVSLF
jgi:vaccinia related kinase